MSVESTRSRCPLCAGHKEPGKIIHTVDLGFGIVVVREVPASVCSQCGEAWVDPRTSDRLEQIVDQAYQDQHQVQIVAMTF